MSTVERNSPLIKSPLTLLIADNLDHVSEVIELFGFKTDFSLNHLTDPSIDLPTDFPNGMLLTYILDQKNTEEFLENYNKTSWIKLPELPTVLHFLTDIALVALKDIRDVSRCKNPERYHDQLEAFLKPGKFE